MNDEHGFRLRQYKRALVDLQRSIDLELEALGADEDRFECSGGIANIAFELIKKAVALQAIEQAGK